MKVALPLFCAVVGNLLYHTSQKLTSHQVNPFLSLGISFAFAALLCFGLFLGTRTKLGGAEGLSWTTLVLGLGLVIIETSFLLAYRTGWPVGLTAICVTVGQTVLLVPLGYLAFGERFGVGALAGACLALAGLALVSLRITPH